MAYLATVATYGFTDVDTAPTLNLYREAGCTACQYYRNEQNPPTTQDVLRIAMDCGLPFDSIHGVFGPDYDPSSPDDAMRRYAIETYRTEAALALDLGGPMVVVHPAPKADKTSQITPEQTAIRAEALQKSMAELARIGEDLGVLYLIENLPGDFHFGFDCTQLADMIRQLNHPQVRMCFDNGHAHLSGNAAKSLEKCLDVIAYLHINDNNARVDSHLIPGHGTCDWDGLRPLIAQLPSHAPAMLELFPTRYQFASAISDGLNELLVKWLSIDSRYLRTSD